MAERSDVVVVGGGIVGVSVAWFLAERGVRVTLLEQGAIASGCSYGNAGWIFPSHSAPIPGPGVLRAGLRWLGDRRSPLYVRPRLDADFLRFLRHFRSACSAERARRAFKVRRALATASLDRYEKLAAVLDLGFERRGLLVACETAEGLEEAREELALLEEHGGEGHELDAAGLRGHAPALGSAVLGGVYYPADAHLVPDRAVLALARAAQERGVRVYTETEVIAIEVGGGRVRSVHATRGDFECEQLVVAAGAWTARVVRPLGVRVPVEPAKGYSITVRRPPGAGDLPVMLSEAKVGVTPMGDRLRFAGTLELAGLDFSVNRLRVEAILDAAHRWLPGLGPLERLETWRGLRPLSPDDLPILGRPRGFENLVLATGHGMSGLCQGPISGELVAALVCGEEPSLDLAPLSPDRFSRGRRTPARGRRP